MSGKPSRNKGKTGELEVVHALQAAGYDVARTPNSGGLQWKGDIQGFAGFHVECKRQETVHADAWCDQAEADCENRMPLVIYRRSRQPWRVILRLSDFLELMERGTR